MLLVSFERSSCLCHEHEITHKLLPCASLGQKLLKVSPMTKGQRRPWCLSGCAIFSRCETWQIKRATTVGSQLACCASASRRNCPSAIVRVARHGPLRQRVDRRRIRAAPPRGGVRGAVAARGQLCAVCRRPCRARAARAAGGGRAGAARGDGHQMSDYPARRDDRCSIDRILQGAEAIWIIMPRRSAAAAARISDRIAQTPQSAKQVCTADLAENAIRARPRTVQL